MKRTKKSMDVATPRRRRSVNDNQFQANTAYQPSSRQHHHMPPPEAPKRKKRFGWKKRIALFFVVILLIAIGLFAYVAAWDLRNFSKASEKLFGTSNGLSALSTTSLQNDKGRVNILMTGYSVDDPGHAGAKLTDSILILSLDQTTHTGYMLSVPRDLYVDIPDYGHAKINEAYQAGEEMDFTEMGYPRGGMGMLEKVLEDNIGLQIHYYALIDYAAVRGTVNALGGVTVNINSTDPRGLYDPSLDLQTRQQLVNLPNGKSLINGDQALGLTRARGAGSGSYGYELSDFTRTQNQQAVFRAIQDELDWKLVLDPRTNEKIFDAASANIQTDVRISEVIPMYRLFTSVPSDQIKTYTLRDINGQNLLTSYRTRLGQSALIPAAGLDDFSEIQSTVSQLQ